MWYQKSAGLNDLSSKDGSCVAALLGLRPRPYGASASAVQGTSALSCNSNYLRYMYLMEIIAWLLLLNTIMKRVILNI
jgi:hypothetical protein